MHDIGDVKHLDLHNNQNDASEFIDLSFSREDWMLLPQSKVVTVFLAAKLY